MMLATAGGSATPFIKTTKENGKTHGGRENISSVVDSNDLRRTDDFGMVIVTPFISFLGSQPP